METLPQIAICVLCHQPLNVNAPHAIVRHDYAHLPCADDYDSRDLGGLDLPPFADEDEELERGDE